MTESLEAQAVLGLNIYEELRQIGHNGSCVWDLNEPEEFDFFDTTGCIEEKYHMCLNSEIPIDCTPPKKILLGLCRN